MIKGFIGVAALAFSLAAALSTRNPRRGQTWAARSGPVRFKVTDVDQYYVYVVPEGVGVLPQRIAKPLFRKEYARVV